MKRPKYIAVCHPVREVTLRGTADLQFWTNKLARQNLQPTECDGRSQILIIAELHTNRMAHPRKRYARAQEDR
jgi:hypothetical protein